MSPEDRSSAASPLRAAPAPAADGQPSRTEILRPFIDQLAALGEHAEAADRPSNVGIGSQNLSVDPWERGVVLDALRAREVGGNSWRALLTESVALWAKTLWDIDRFQRNTGQQSNPIVDDLCYDATIGYALVTDLQGAVDRLLVDGQMEPARRLTQYRNRFSQFVWGLKELIGEDALEDAKHDAMDLIADSETLYGRQSDAGVESGADAKRGPRPLGRPVARSRREPPAAPEADDESDIEALLALEQELRDKQPLFENPPEIPASEIPEIGPRPLVRKLALVLIVLFLVWFKLVAWPALTRPDLVVLAPEHFADLPQVREVVARPPSLFVKVGPKAWHKMTTQERLELIEVIGERAERAGYSGAHVTYTTGRAIGQWLKTRGARLYVPPGSSS